MIRNAWGCRNASLCDQPLNSFERWFVGITAKRIRRGTFLGVTKPSHATQGYIWTGARESGLPDWIA
jgi:hypothetical protein